MRRAAHQVLDRPLIFEDPLALRIVGPDGASEIHGAPAQFETPIRRLMRAFLVMRSRYAEDLLGAAVARGVRQYVLLGAGLDTFAYRNPYVGVGLRVFEVDHPATQAWKRERLAAAGIPVPPVSVLAFAPVDFERSTVLAGLEAVAFDPTRPAVLAWLGVVPYLTREAVVGTLDLIAGACAPGSEVIFDYSEPPERLDPARRAVFETRARAVASFGEPFITFFDTVELVAVLRGVGFTTTDDLDVDGLNARYAADPADALRVGGIGHIMRACV